MGPGKPTESSVQGLGLEGETQQLRNADQYFFSDWKALGKGGVGRGTTSADSPACAALAPAV